MDSFDENDNEEVANDEELLNNDEPSNNEEVQEQPPALEENEADMDVEPPKSGNFLGVASKKLINFLLKRKIIAIGVIVAIFILFISIFLGSNTSTKTFDYKYMESLDNKCESVEVIYNPYGANESSSKTMKLEDYVAAATYTYTKELKNKDAGIYHLYKALAIALRNEVIYNDCKVTYRDKRIYNKPSYGQATLDEALDSANGVVMSKAGKKKIMNVNVSDFCYSTNDGTNYSIFQVPDFKIPTSWVNANVPSKYKDCPCNQPNESLSSCYAEQDYKEWAHQDDTSGFNVYAAYYLLEEYKLNWSDILQYFLGDHSYWTINKEQDDEDELANANQLAENCGTMDLHKTTLTKSQFVAGLKSFNYTGAMQDGWKLFLTNAEMIYDVALENNINPEFVIIRAILEGFSPDFDESGNRRFTYNNYWGWGCNNGLDLSLCVDFGTDFEAAIAEYCQAVNRQYSDYNDLLKSYAFLGYYWYNPGSSGDGGCYYAPYIFPNGIPSRVQNACNGPQCYINGDTTNCVPTTNEEQVLYGKYQDRNTQKYRKAIWNIDENDCKMTASGAGCMWWPIGSTETTQKDGITYADGDPETTTITSGFGLRDAPTANASTNHNAIDIGGGRERRTNVIAAADGIVTDTTTGCIAGDTSCGGFLGNAVYISHSDGSITRYGHLYSVAVSKGDNVKQGQVIGKLGNTGNSTGPHLDFKVQINGEAVDPTNYVSASDPRKICSGDGSVVEGEDSKQTICLTLKNSGYNDKAIAGIMGNLQQESDFNPKSVNSTNHRGIAQWETARFNNLKSIYGDGSYSVGNQIKFLIKELNESYSSTEKYLRENNHSETEYAYNFCMNYERPGKDDCENSKRKTYATNLLSYVENGCK